MHDSATLAGTQFTAVAVTTLLAVLVARYLGPGDFGIFAGFLGLAQVVMFFSALGVATWLLRELSQWAAAERPDDHEAGRMLSASLALTGWAAVMLTAGSAAVAFAIAASPELALAVAALMAYVGMLTFASVIEVVFRAQRKLRRVVVATALEKGTLAALVVAAVVGEAGIGGICVAYTAAGVTRIGWDLLVLRRERPFALVGATRTDVWTVLRGSVPFGFGSAMPSAIVRLDIFLLALISASSAGLYAVADRFIGVLLIIPTACAGALYPHLARQASTLRASWKAALGLGLVGALLAGAGIAAAPAAVDLLFGATYSDAIPVVRVILLAAPLLFATAILLAGLFSAGHDRVIVPVMLAGTVGGTGLVIAGQALVGPEGAAAGYVGRYAILLLALSIVSVLLYRRGADAPAPRPAAGAPEPAQVAGDHAIVPLDPPPLGVPPRA